MYEQNWVLIDFFLIFKLSIKKFEIFKLEANGFIYNIYMYILNHAL